MKPISYTPVVLAAALLPFAQASYAQTALTPSGDFISGQTWAGYSWNGWLPVLPDGAFTSRLTEPSQTISTEVYFHLTSPGYDLHPDWTGTFQVTGTASAGNQTNLQAGSLYHFNALSSAGARALTGPTLGGTQQFFERGGASTWVYDFSGLVNGSLPAGTMFWIYDMDAYPSSNLIEGPLTFQGDSPDPFLNLVWQGNLANSGQATVLPDVFWDSAGIYTMDNTHGSVFNNVSGDLSVFYTTRDLTELTVVSKSGGEANHSFFIYAPVLPIPEPSSALLLSLTATLTLLHRRRTG